MFSRKPEYPESRFLATDPDFDSENVVMQIQLTFDGALMSTGNASRPKHVHSIRKQFHPQLKRFWQVNSFLKEYGDVYAKHQAPYTIRDYQFQPLVRRADDLLIGVEILLLRIGIEGGIFNGGDLDGRLATLFDAFAPPRHNEQLPHEPPTDDEKPFFCLVEDDSLLTHVDIETGELLQDTRDGLDGNAARILVTVRVSPRSNLGFGKLL